MTERNSEQSILHAYETGVRSFSLKGKTPTFGLSAIDFGPILASKSPKKEIQSLATPLLYKSLLSRGLQDCAEILPLISNDQWENLVDYDCWQHGTLSAPKFFQWIKIFREHSNRHAFERVQDLEENLQIALLASLVRVFDQEAYDAMSPSQQDSLNRFPGDALYYSILSENAEIVEGVQSLVECGMETDMNYVMSLMAHASQMPPNECHEMSRQFRNARLEEDGFLPEEEISLMLSPLKPVETTKLLGQVKTIQSHTPQSDAVALFESTDFLEKVVSDIEKQGSSETAQAIRNNFLYLANGIASFAGIDAGDNQGLKACLEQSIQMVSLGLSILSKNQVDLAAKILIAEYPKTMMRYAISVLNELKYDVLASFAKVGFDTEKLNAYLTRNKYGRLLRHFDTEFLELVGHEQVEMIKGFLNRFPVALVSSTGEQRLVFKPIENMTGLRSAYSQILAVAANAYLVQGAGKPNRTIDEKVKALVANLPGETELDTETILNQAAVKLNQEVLSWLELSSISKEYFSTEETLAYLRDFLSNQLADAKTQLSPVKQPHDKETSL